MEQKITRAFNLTELATNDEGNIVEGYATVFNSFTNIGGYFLEQIDARAFDDCIFDDACLLVNHDTSRIALARCRRNTPNSTLQLSVDSKGLHQRAVLDIENNADARSLYSAIKRGDINGMSFMFTVEGEKWDDLESDLPKRTITKISRVYEVSAVNFPAYEDTEIYARSADTLENAQKALANARSASLANDNDLELLKAKILFNIKAKGGMK